MLAEGRHIFGRVGSAFSLFEEQAQDLSAYCHLHSLSIFQKTLHCTGKQRSRLLWNYWIQSSPKDSKPSADNNTRYSLAKSITGCIKFIKRVALWMDFWQLDDIFEILGQNESLHGKRTVVFCLSLSPPQRLPLGIPIKIENNRKNGKRAGTNTNRPLRRRGCLSPRTHYGRVRLARERARLLTLFLPYAKPILKKTRTVLQSTTRRT